jgi:hypothetical protein
LSEYELAEFELRRFIRFRLEESHSDAEQIVNKLLDSKFLRNMLRHWVETEELCMNYEGMIRELEFYEERDRLRRPAEELDVNQAEDLATPC